MREVTVVYHQEPDGWWAESAQVSGYVATGETLGRVRDLVQGGLPFFLEDDDIQISETLADDLLPVKLSFSFQGPLVAAGVASFGLPVVFNYASPPASAYEPDQGSLAAA